MPSKFIHLHVHSHYSLLNALPKIPELVKEAKKNEMSALALTDNANLYGAIEFYKACKKENIKPIIGADMYVATRTRNDKQGGVDNRRSRLVLLVKDLTGYHNLIKLTTVAHLDFTLSDSYGQVEEGLSVLVWGVIIVGIVLIAVVVIVVIVVVMGGRKAPVQPVMGPQPQMTAQAAATTARPTRAAVIRSRASWVFPLSPPLVIH